MSAPDIAAIAKGLTMAQREYAMGRYDDDFVSYADASALERVGIWVTAENEGEMPSLILTPLGLAVRAYLMEHGDA